jgi:hypothetical protein
METIQFHQPTIAQETQGKLNQSMARYVVGISLSLILVFLKGIESVMIGKQHVSRPQVLD